jgi:hypothetical protein
VRRPLLDLDAALRAALGLNALLGAAAIGTWLVVAAAHIDDGYHVDHVAGAWMGLTRYAEQGTLYPPLHEGSFFGGTRYMPLPIVLNAVAATASREHLVSGKVVAALVMVALLALVWHTAVRMGAPRSLALGAAGAVVATFTALFAGTTIYGDALPVLLQVGAIAVVLRGTAPRAVAIAGVLAALAVTAKLSAFWGLAAVLLWLLVRDWRRIPLFVAAVASTGIAALGVAELASQGRFSENIRALAFSGFAGFEALLVDSPSKALDLLAARADATLLLLPVAALALAFAIHRRAPDPVTIAVLPAGAVTLVVLADEGTDFNHLLDLAVLAPLVAVGAYKRAATSVRLALAVLVAIAIALSLSELRHDAREAASALVHRETPERLRVPPLAGRVVEPSFSEDPGVDVQRDRMPVALDTFTLLRLLEEHPDWERELIARFDRREFATVVLIQDLDLADPWWSESHLGLGIASAIARNYRLAERLPGPVFRYRLYVPRSGATSAASSPTSTRSRPSTSQDGTAESSSSE